MGGGLWGGGGCCCGGVGRVLTPLFSLEQFVSGMDE